MPTIEEMDDFVDWGNAGAAFGGAFNNVPNMTTVPGHPQPDDNIGLVLENASEDEFSFQALEHFSQNNFRLLGNDPPTMNLLTDSPVQLLWETPANPCAHCVLGGYACKKIREGIHKGYCTSCVALGLECSFGGVVPDNLNPESTRLSSWAANSNRLNAITQEDISESARPSGSTSFTDLLNQPATGDDASAAAIAIAKAGTPPPKIGARFSRESVRILKNWLLTHNRHPYPSDEEKEMLQRQTGLNKIQITNWLANARRRGKAQPPRSTSPHTRNPRLGGHEPLAALGALSPEHEPASVTAIARAVTASDSSAISSGLNSPYSFNYTDDGSNKSLCNQSSASSVGTSQSSNGSLASAYSQGTQNSWGSFGSAPFNNRGRRRRRRRTATKKEAPTSTSLAAPLKTFQCTFCTETFRTKHDWQRHEKSLHLSLERWVCAPDGPRAVNPENGVTCCVFCGEANPDNAHIDTHNHAACQERSLEERTFYRKDHLNQHLRLVHNVKFMDWSMKSWKVATPEIRSRCGFCGIVMDTWTIRVDHLAEHFKTGFSMADWKGDWGFELPVLDMVENSIPPYLIHHERLSPNPYLAGNSPPASPRNAYELIKLELAYFGTNYWEQHGRAPTDEDMLLEGCRIIFASELLSLQGIATQPSWLRDLIMSNKGTAEKARFGPLRGAAENRLQILKINGKDNLFEACPMENQLHAFVKAKRLLGLTAMDDELQEEACRIVGRVEEVCTHPSEEVANWLLRSIRSTTDWLPGFRKRAHLPRSEDVQERAIRSTDPTSIDSTIHNYSRLECELADFLKQQRSAGTEPTDEDLQREARMIIYEFDDGWNQTVADNLDWLAAFRERYGPGSRCSPNREPPNSPPKTAGPSSYSRRSNSHLKESSPGDGFRSEFGSRVDANGEQARGLAFFLSDANCYRRLAKELRRWVVSTMSPINPNQHVPSDEELQYQARWIIYDDDDPWNQTAADNAEWLRRFKRDVGILKEEGPGLPAIDAWAIEQGGTGFAPPYAYPKGHMEPFGEQVEVPMKAGARQFTAGQSAANSYLETLSSPAFCQPAAVFCSRELERGLEEYVKQFMAHYGYFPCDSALQRRAREILNSDKTAADDPVLLRTFKVYVLEKMDKETAESACPLMGQAENQQQQQGQADKPASPMPANMDLNISDADLGDILKDMDFDFSADDFEVGAMEGIEEDGGVSLSMATPPGDLGPSLFDDL
ncbi:Homeobox protein 4 [Cladobotryum mycophilum]|uniref:Homeobox protein 4 n=1 Tax=Cladobotryum mycophilum TaxID=491253 RepID=A0ABR0T2X7_9HYPO